jgi:hypothetical protein
VNEVWQALAREAGERYYAKVEELIGSYENPLACLDLERELVSTMLYLLNRSFTWRLPMAIESGY